MGNVRSPLSLLLGFIYLWHAGACWPDETNRPPDGATSTRATNTSKAIRRGAGTTVLHDRGAEAPSSKPASAPEFEIKPGFQIEVVAPGFELTAPVALAFDERGRLFVAERPGAPNASDRQQAGGRIRLFQDTKGEGVFDTSTVYAGDLARPSAVACYQGGIFVATASEILYLKDTHGDGIADIRKVVYRLEGTPNAAADADLNSLAWGPDNRFHVATAGLGAALSATEAGAEPAELGRHDFSFDPRTLTTSPESGHGAAGMTFDDSGRKYTCDVDRPLRLAILPPRYVARNPFVPMPAEVVDVVAPGSQVFAWPNSDTRRPTPGRNELTPAWFADARGAVIYRGHAFPSNYLGNAFIADAAAHIIHRAVLQDNGLEVVAVRPRDEQTSEFLVSRGPLFQPMQIVNAPDGALYVADRHGGGAGGRIFRIAPANFHPPNALGLNRTNTVGLVLDLAHLNGWHRDTAARLLYEQRDGAAVPLLSNVVHNARSPLARLQAFNVLASLGALNESQLLHALKDPDERVRAAAVLNSEKLFRAGINSDALWTQLASLAADRSIRVRYQLALSLGEVSLPQQPLVLASVLGPDVNNPWMRAAVLTSLSTGGGQAFSALAANPRFRNVPAGWLFLQQLAGMIGVEARPEELGPALAFLDRDLLLLPQTYRLLCNLGEGLEHNQRSLVQADPAGHLARFYARALTDTLNDNELTTVRVEAIRLLGVSSYSYAQVGDWLWLLLGSGEPDSIKSATLATLSHYSDPTVATKVIARWRAYSPEVRRDAVAALLARDERVPAVVTALGLGSIPPADMPAWAVDFLRTYREPYIRQAALRLFGPVSLARPAALESGKPALRTTAVAGRGRVVFLARCASCHRFNQEGQQLGPDLDRFKAQDKATWLTRILEPNLQLPPDLAVRVVVTKTGENFLGIQENDNPITLILRQPDAVPIVLPRSNLLSVQGQPWSLMPEGLERGLNLQNLADLLEYLTSSR